MGGFLLLALTLGALALLLAPVQGKELLANWQVGDDSGNISYSGNETRELIWAYRYGRKPAVLRQTSHDAWQKTRGIDFSIRSDRVGRLFLRIDQTDGRIFLCHFSVSKEWRQKHLAYAEFTPFGNTSGQVAPSRIRAIYLVDLNGPDGGFTGHRSVWIKQMQPWHSEGDNKTAAIPLLAYDSRGDIITLKGFKSRGLSGGRWCYLSGPDGNSLPMQLRETKGMVGGRSRKLPTVITDKNKPAALEILYWPVGEQYKVRLQANPDGRGIGATNTAGYLHLNLALAQTRYRILCDYVEQHRLKWTKQLAVAGDRLADIERETDPRSQAARADELLLDLLNLSRDVVRQHAAARLEELLATGEEVAVPAPAPDLLKKGQRVTIGLEDPAFRIGMGEGFGFVWHKTPPARIDAFYTELRRAGFNMVTLPLYWDQVVDAEGRPTQWQDTLRFDTLARLGFTLHAHGFVQSGMPDAVRPLKGTAFVEAGKKHMTDLAGRLAGRYGKQMILWQAVNEPASNAFGGSTVEERIGMVSDFICHMRTLLPEARVVVNDYDWERGIEAGRELSDRSIIGTLPFYRELLKAPNRPDLLALEWYPGARVERPEFRVDLSEPCMDLLDTSLYWDRFLDLGLPLIFTESNFPGSMRKNDLNGYAWGRWDRASQAQAAVDTLILALSKPDIHGLVWWSVTDNEPWNRNGGLFTAEGNPKPVFKAISAQIQRLKEAKTVTVKASGKLPVPALPGIWRIKIEGGPTWRIERDRSGKISPAIL